MSQGPSHDDEAPKAPGVRPEAMSSLLKELLLQGTARDQSSRGEPRSGSMVGRFELVRELGRGGFGVVYEAKDVQLQRSVAVKLLRVGETGLSEQLQREAELVARLSHPNLVTLFDVGLSEQGPYLVLELLKGQTLQQRLDAGPLGVAEAVRIAVEVARGLAYAHGEGVVHRDLKPSNVFLTSRGAVKLLDFGMAHAFGRRRVSGGTPAYMAPEQWKEAPEDERTDVFALGVMLHRMLTGEYPYGEQGGKWSSGPAEPATLEVAGARELEVLVSRMLERDPTSRPRDGAEVLATLEAIEESLPAGTAPVKITRRRARLADLFAELKRRRVFRVMAAYGIFSFAVLQVIEPIMHGAHLPDWVLTATLVALAVGFPAAVILSWVFDLTADGVKRTPKVRGAVTLSRTRLVALLASVALLAALPVAGWYTWKRARETAAAAPAAGTASIAVLPFADLSPNHDQDYFSDGVAEEILTALSKVEGLKVPGRASCFWFKGKNADPAEIAGKLGVAHLLEGSVRRAGNKLRISAELIKVAGGERLWSQTFDRELTDVFAIQDEIARAVVTALRAKFALGATPKTQSPPTTSTEAYRFFLLGRSLVYQGSVEVLPRAITALEQAVAIDPGLVMAHVWLGVANGNLAIESSGPTASRHVQRVREAIDRAIATGPEEVAAYAVRGWYRTVFEWDWTGARADFDKAATLSPGEALTPGVLLLLNNEAILLDKLGQYEGAIAKERRVVEAEPLNVVNTLNLASFLQDAGRLEEARGMVRRALEVSPEADRARAELATIDLLEGKTGEALEGFRRLGPAGLDGVTAAAYTMGLEAESLAALDALKRNHANRPFRIGSAHAWRGERDQAFEWLERAYQARDPELRHVMYFPLLRPLRGDRRYRELLTRMKLPADGSTAPAPAASDASIAPSIAVLPFADMSEKHDQEYFADGVAEEIINALAHVQGLKVIARTSSFSFKEKNEDLRRIGQQLDVAHVLEGSVRKSGGRVRVAAQLIRVADGSHLWSEVYERPLADVFAVQDELARAVTRALGPRLVGAAPRPGRQTASPAAHDLYLRGLALWNLRTVDGLHRAVDLFRQAVALDPGYALAHVGLANALAHTIQYAQVNPHPLLEQAEAEARRALQLDPGIGEAHAALGSALEHAGDWAGARRAFEEAVRLSPDDATAHQWLGENLLVRGMMAAGRAELERARALDPASRIINTVVSWGAYLARDYPASELAARRALELAPDFSVARYQLAVAVALQGRARESLVELARVDSHQSWSPHVVLVLARAGRSEEALRYAEEVEARARQVYVPPGFLAHIRAANGQVDLAFEAFGQACRTRDVHWVNGAFSDPNFDALRRDLRWKEVLTCLKLP